ncbi:MAG: ArsR/SmtB family transcription factor [Candidatus Anammoxibacter sp.]
MKNFMSTNECAQILKAMGDETRLLILKCLFKGEKCGTELAEELNMSQPHIAHHLGILKNANLLESWREAQRVCYRLHPVVHESLRKNNDMTIDLGCCKMSFRDESNE